jgi:hypothetical protein
VEYAVKGVKGANMLHWVEAYGIIDNDARTHEEIEQSKKRGVYAIPAFSVESIYYDPEIQRLVGERHAELLNEDASENLHKAKEAALKAIEHQKEHLCASVVERLVRKKLFDQLPRRKDIKDGKLVEVSIGVDNLFKTEINKLQKAIDDENLKDIITRYPVRDSGALDAIAKKLEFQGRKQYEKAVIKLLMDDTEALEYVRSIFGDLAEKIQNTD